jgi:iron complex outermembrane recepter protein
LLGRYYSGARVNNTNWSAFFVAGTALSVAVSCLLFPNTALAQKKQRAELEEILVTAQRREESAQEVPISVTVFSQDQVSKANITNASDLAAYTPSLSANTNLGSESATFSLRGFSQTIRTAATVATYFAEVVAPRGAIAQPSGDGAGPGYFYDLQNVQVLKGPQGTLFGRNTTGGAVLLVPNRPSDEFEGYMEFSGGDYSAKQQQLVVNLPVSDSFKIRFGIDDNERDGYLNNITGIGADDFANVNYTAYRLGVLWDISDKIENYTVLNYVDSKSNGYVMSLLDCNPDPTAQFYLITGRGCEQDLAEREAQGQNGFYDVASSAKTPLSIIKEKRLINTTTWNAFENVSFKNILAYGHLETVNSSDVWGMNFKETSLTGIDLSPLQSVLGLLGDVVGNLPALSPNRKFAMGGSILKPGTPTASQITWVEELRAEGIAFDGKMVWQTGLYYEDSRPDRVSGGTTATLVYCDLSTLEGDPSQFDCFDPLGGLIGGVLLTDLEYSFLGQAVYGQMTYDVTENVGVTAGLRYTRDESEGEGEKTNYQYLLTVQRAAIVTETNPKVSSEAPTGLLEVDYKPFGDAAMFYAKYVRGYRQGGINMNADPGLDTFGHETIDNYEIGAKTQFGGPVPGRFNIAVFSNDLTDMQIQTGYISPTSGPTTTIVNAGKARVDGVEVEGFFSLADGLNLVLSYSKLDTELLEQLPFNSAIIAEAVTAQTGNFLSGQIAAGTATASVAEGENLPFAADESWVASLSYDLPLSPSLGVINIGATYAYTGNVRVAADGTSPYAVLDDFSILNLNASWESILGTRFDLTVFGTNVTDEEYLTFSSGIYEATSFDNGQVGAPKMLGARLRYSF